MNPDFQLPELEQRELDSLAAELRDAMPVVPLSDDFQQRLEAQLHNSWTLRGAFQRNGVIRLAAGLLVMTLAAAPVAAWVGLWPQQKKSPPTIDFELPDVVDVDQEGGVLGDGDGSLVVAPEDEFDTFEWTDERSVAVERSNRLALAAASYEASDVNLEFPPERAASWSSADPGALWGEFGRRCENADLSPLNQTLIARCEALIQTPLGVAPTAEEIAARAAWAWVLHGEKAAAGSVVVDWPQAPFIAAQ